MHDITLNTLFCHAGNIDITQKTTTCIQYQ